MKKVVTFHFNREQIAEILTHYVRSEHAQVASGRVIVVEFPNMNELHPNANVVVTTDRIQEDTR